MTLMEWFDRLFLHVTLTAFVCGGLHATDVRVNDTGHVEARGADVRVFRGAAKTPLFGSVTHAGAITRFAPTLPLVAGESYRVEVQAADGTWHLHSLIIPKPPGAPPTAHLLTVDAVFPANALKLYLQFSQPMEQGVFLDRISLHRQDESIVEGPFRETELWSPDGTRLTLWLHPGRQKAGVNLNTDEGPVLVEGERHTLKVTPPWRSAAGMPLEQALTFGIQVGAPDHQCPDPQRWQITAPKRGTRDPLRLRFDETLDPAMLRSAITIRSGSQEWKGSIQVPPDARSWSFRPEQPWPPGRHEIVIDPLLEDLAGNNLQHPFEVDREQAAKPKAGAPTLSFEVP